MVIPPSTGTAKSLREQLLERKAALWTERASWDSHWRECAQYQLPRAGRFAGAETNDGRKKHQSIYDNTGLLAQRTLAGGMMSGATSPARPWFLLGIADADLMEFAPVKTWLHGVTEMMRRIFSASNTYNALHSCYEELGCFGTWANFVRPDFHNVIHHYPMTVGEYALAVNERGEVDTLVRELRMSVRQMIGLFGRDACSMAVRNLWDRQNDYAMVDVMHFIDPRTDRDPRSKSSRHMPYRSVYLEPGSGDANAVLSESGFKRFPALCPRWTITGNDTYGRSPGMDVLGDVKQLQHQQLRKSQAIDLQVNPPLQVPVAYKDQAQNRLPGGVMFVDTSGPGGGIRSAFESTLRLDYLLADIQDVRDRVRKGTFADLFLMLANDTRSGTTATEIAERHEEKLLMLGPVMERLHSELLSPLIDVTFDRMVEAGMLTGRLQPPPELQGMDLNIEFISTLAQAQRAVASNGTDRLLAAVGQLAAAKGDPSVWDKIDTDQAIDDYGGFFGVNPKLIVPDEQVAALRQQRAQAQQAQQMMASAPQLVDSAKSLGDTNVSGLQDVMNSFQGYSTAVN